MVITYRRVGTGAVLPALVAAGVVTVVGGIAAVIATATLATVGVLWVGGRLAHALGLRQHTPPPAVRADTIIEGVVVHPAPADGAPTPAEVAWLCGTTARDTPFLTPLSRRGRRHQRVD